MRSFLPKISDDGIDLADVAQHARLEGDRIERHAVAPHRRLGLGGADQVVPDIAVQPDLRRFHDLVQRYVFVFQTARHGSPAVDTLDLAQQTRSEEAMAAQDGQQAQPCCRAKRKSAFARSTASSALRSRASICAGRSRRCAVQDRPRRLRELRGDRAARPGHHGRPADGVRRAVRRAVDPSLLAQPAGQARGHHPRLLGRQPAGADRHLACRRDLPRGAADGDHPARQGRARGRRRHAVRLDECRLSRPQRAHEAAHPWARSAARLQAVAAAVRPQRPRQAAQARGRLPQPVASGGARASGERPARALRQPPVLHPHQGPQGRRERYAAGVPLPPGHHPRVSAPGEVAAQHAGDVGQPLGPALRQPRLLPGAAHHGAGDGEGRQAAGRRPAPTRRTRCRPTARSKPAIAEGTRPGPKRAFDRY